MKRLLYAYAAALPLFAHMVSMSSGELQVQGDRAHYELRIPMYEVAHVRQPEHTLLEQVRFKDAGVWATPLNPSCGQQQETYVCTADYRFPGPVDVLQAECTLAKVTVPNHVHLLHAYRGDKSDQAVFDLSFTTAEIRFRSPTPFETLARESSAGFMRAAAGLAPLLFLASLVLAARRPRELIVLTLSFLAAEALSSVLVPRFSISFSPRFIEAAAALTVAYLAFEIVLLPGSRHRWIVVAVLGLFHGAYFSTFLAQSNYRAPVFFSGVALAELLLIGLFALAAAGLAHFSILRRAVPLAASLLLVTGIVWFFLRLRA
ncbi:MAG TPA: HupE/UreJ family protein [Bryobacteraceae bacterium]|nr:HupE/UreJ family protein [Bryobacteraceae bacterium]